MKTNPILDDIRRFRDEHAKRFNYDLTAIVADIRRHERELRKQGWRFGGPKGPRSRNAKVAA